MPLRLLVDTDLGSDADDALALLQLLGEPQVELVGVTTVYGPADLRARLARRLLDAAGCRAPVVAGAREPLGSPIPIWLTGREGAGVLDERDLARPLAEEGIGEEADEFLVERILAEPGELTLLCLGPLTNLARALRLEPAIAGAVRAVVLMGGGIAPPCSAPPRLPKGAVFPAPPSHNVRCDVRAAQLVLAAPFARLSMVTNGVTERLLWRGEGLKALLERPRTPAAALVARLVAEWLRFIGHDAEQGLVPHDPLAAAEACGHSFTTVARGRMEILDGGESVFAVDPAGPHAVAWRVDAERFLSWFSERMRAS